MHQKENEMKIINYVDISQIDFIFFDKGGTLSYQNPHTDDGVEEAKKIMNFLGYKGDPVEFRKTLKERDKKYKKWSLEKCYEETVEVICKKWLYFDAPFYEKIDINADKLVIMSSHVKGDRILFPEATPLVKEMKRRGYRTGLISNTVSLSLVPGELREADIYNDLEVVVMSSLERLRKPDPEIFRLSCERAGVAPERCVYIGDAPNRDVEGPRKAGFGGVVIVKGKNYDPERDKGPMREPDIVVDSLEELYDLFLEKSGVKNEINV